MKVDRNYRTNSHPGCQCEYCAGHGNVVLTRLGGIPRACGTASGGRETIILRSLSGNDIRKLFHLLKTRKKSRILVSAG